MRRAGANPTDIQVLDFINKIDNDSGTLDFPVWKDNFIVCLVPSTNHPPSHYLIPSYRDYKSPAVIVLNLIKYEE